MNIKNLKKKSEKNKKSGISASTNIQKLFVIHEKVKSQQLSNNLVSNIKDA